MNPESCIEDYDSHEGNLVPVPPQATNPRPRLLLQHATMLEEARLEYLTDYINSKGNGYYQCIDGEWYHSNEPWTPEP